MSNCPTNSFGYQNDLNSKIVAITGDHNAIVKWSRAIISLSGLACSYLVKKINGILPGKHWSTMDKVK